VIDDDRNRILDSLYAGEATAKDIAAELEMSRRYVERLLIDAFCEGLVERKAFKRYRTDVHIYWLKRTKKSAAA